MVVVGAGSLDHDPLIDTATKLLAGVSATASASSSPNVFVGSDIEYRFDSMRVCFFQSWFNIFVGGTCCYCFSICSC